jgi:hypothetical protein
MVVVVRGGGGFCFTVVVVRGGGGGGVVVVVVGGGGGGGGSTVVVVVSVVTCSWNAMSSMLRGPVDMGATRHRDPGRTEKRESGVASVGSSSLVRV